MVGSKDIGWRGAGVPGCKGGVSERKNLQANLRPVRLVQGAVGENAVHTHRFGKTRRQWSAKRVELLQ
jgi:hypothetical protein